MTRHLHDWLTEFVGNSAWGEAPQKMYFWVGVGTIAAALQRKVWIDQISFQWYPNLYILLVADPGVIAKSTTTDLGFKHLLRNIPGIKFGPSTLTWQSLYDALAEVGEEIVTPWGEVITQQSLVISAREFGTLVNPKDTELIDQLVSIWDCETISKRTRMDGQTNILTPCLNIISCTTPAWISENVPRYMIGGGFASRTIFVYGKEKEQFVAYPRKKVPPDYKERKSRLISDLEQISKLVGEYTLTPEAEEWGEAWYEHFHREESKKLDQTLVGGYIARKQTLAHKVAMCLAASKRDRLIIEKDDLQRATRLLTELEADMPFVYAKIGLSAEAEAGESIISFLRRYEGRVPFTILYKHMHPRFPRPEDFERVMEGLKNAGKVKIVGSNIQNAFVELGL